ncbi:hypothetical protein BYT27DRAFT_7226027 [Phlegmacium glaucopus]|nr:hypothetical protein BYT27DRAFT_7226027 [Phlegmacium glaucopus]
MSLSKIPIIALVTLLLKAGLTVHQPPPSKAEQVPSTAIDIPRARRIRFKIFHVTQMLVAGLEIATLIANATPSSKLSRTILSMLASNGGTPHKLRMTPVSTIGAALIAGGMMLRMRTFRELGRFFRYDISIQKDHELIISGPYAYVRHPSYTGLLLANIGWFLWNSASGSWVMESGLWTTVAGKALFIAYALNLIVFASIVTLSRMGAEDVALRKQFGSAWDEWAKKVPYFVIPGIY